MALTSSIMAVEIVGGIVSNSLNLKAVFPHVLSDALSSIGVIAAAIIIYLTEWAIIDPS